MSCTVYINTDSHMWLNSKSEAEQKIIDFVILQRREMCQDDLITLCNELGYEQMIMRRPWISFDMVNVWFYWHVKEEFNQRLKRSCCRLQPIRQASVEQYIVAWFRKCLRTLSQFFELKHKLFIWSAIEFIETTFNSNRTLKHSISKNLTFGKG